MKPAVSIIVPVYKVEKYLDRCLASLLSQSLTDIEIILVDDGSPDRSGTMCDEYAAKDNRIRVVHKKNAGLGMACNSGIDIATGEYLLFVDSDDWIEKDMCKDLYGLAKEKNADMVFSGLRTVDEHGNFNTLASYSKVRELRNRKIINAFSLDMIASDVAERCERSVPMSAKIVLYRHGLINVNNLQFESERKLISEDIIFNLDCLQKVNCVVLTDSIYYNYYVNTSSLSRKIRSDRFEKALDLREELLCRYSDLSNEVDFRERVDRLFIGYCRVACCQIVNAKNIGWRDKYKLLKNITDHSVWKDIKNNYPINKMPIKHRLFLYAILYKNILAINIFSLISGI